MKKAISISIIFIVFFLNGKTQHHVFEYGLHGGINFNTAHGTAINKDAAGNLRGINIGGYVKRNISNSFGVKAMLQYEQNGWAYRSLTFENADSTGLSKGDVLIKLNYLNLPVVAEYSFGNKINFYTHAGLFFGVLLNNKMITKIKNQEPPYTVTTTNSSNSKKSANYGIALGAGIQVPLRSNIKLSIGLHNNLGLVNINKSSEGQSASSIKTNSFSILGGIGFTL